MASVILDWRRVVASVRVHPPATIKRGIADVLRHEPLLLPLLRESGGELKVQTILYQAISEVVRTRNGKIGELREKIEEYARDLKPLKEYLQRLIAAMEKLEEYNEKVASQLQSQKAAAYACTQPRIWFADAPVAHIQVPAWARK